ncbi:cytochrome-c oxidase, cbb3-type subunit III [Thalassotalea sp. M1531]|uniref:Cbb3-type cytochrome c oxidase subunit n=1 Tax=Thalassotalea algicola TaxID=2716224 RepID=A0A7Y0Q741_9GAMM|nr:cytochrome-c oxidase, cbb3-type subunit III [Thalassotalea algicola]NMP31472.1 cytochrome-c oxidase, cbb3-type subunit III [Thalassotalea algicola]
MSSFWSIWIAVLTLGTLVGCYILLRWCLKNFAGVPEGESMGHEFDGIEELNNPLPKWWSTFFLLTIIWGFGYLALYPGVFGSNWDGLLGWKSSNQDVLTLDSSKAQTASSLAEGSGLLVEYDREVARAEEKYGPIFEAYAARSIEDLATDEEALKVGQRLFLQNCAQCHGSDARGTTGFPNLADKDWLYSGDAAAIKASIMDGRKANGMMPWKAALGGEQGVKEMAAYVLSLSGREVNADDAAKAAPKFAMCAACHGDAGQGSAEMGIALGAPALNDNIWLYGGSQKAVEESIRNGRAGVMPAWQHILGEDKVHVISAYVYSLSQK